MSRSISVPRWPAATRRWLTPEPQSIRILRPAPSTRWDGPARRRLTGGAPVPRKVKARSDAKAILRDRQAARSSATSDLVVLVGRTLELLQLGEDGIDVDRRFLLALRLAHISERLARMDRLPRGGLLGREQGRACLRKGGRAILGCTTDLEVEIDLRAEPEADRVDRRQGLRVPVGAVADLGDGRFRRADQADDLRVLELGMVAQQPEDRVRAVLALGNRGVARPLGALDLRYLHLALGKPEMVVRVLGGALELLTGELTRGDRVEALDAGGDFAIGD